MGRQESNQTNKQNKDLRHDCNSKCIEWIEGHYLEVVVEVYDKAPVC